MVDSRQLEVSWAETAEEVAAEKVVEEIVHMGCNRMSNHRT